MAVKANEIRPDWITREGQSLFDLAIQLYGSIDNLGTIMEQFSTIEDPPTGTVITVDPTDNFLALNLFSQKLVVTSQGDDGEGSGDVYSDEYTDVYA